LIYYFLRDSSILAAYATFDDGIEHLGENNMKTRRNISTAMAFAITIGTLSSASA
jgi:hypothetical protein